MSIKRPQVVAEILTIGREILDGRVIDTNAVYLALGLKKIGLVPRYSQSVDDDMDRIIEAFEWASRRSQVILVTGGLGPTSDDMTVEAFARYLKVPLHEDLQAKKELIEKLDKMGRSVNESHLKQIKIPQGAQALPNPAGTAPGVYFQKGDQTWVFLPGVPREMKAIFEESVLKILPENSGYHSVSFLTEFTLEAELNQRLQTFQNRLPQNVEITYQTRFPENIIGIHGEDQNFFKFVGELESILGKDSVAKSEDRGDLPSLEKIVLDLLISKNIQMTSVESCTGGQIYQRLTSLSGSSAAVWGSFGVYDNTAKIALGVDPALIQKNGAVSGEVAKHLAFMGWKKTLGISAKKICVSTTGIAGPSGGTAEKPVGLCYVGLAFGDSKLEEPQILLDLKIQARSHLPRNEIQRYFSQQALDWVRKTISNNN